MIITLYCIVKNIIALTMKVFYVQLVLSQHYLLLATNMSLHNQYSVDDKSEKINRTLMPQSIFSVTNIPQYLFSLSFIRKTWQELSTHLYIQFLEKTAHSCTLLCSWYHRWKKSFWVFSWWISPYACSSSRISWTTSCVFSTSAPLRNNFSASTTQPFPSFDFITRWAVSDCCCCWPNQTLLPTAVPLHVIAPFPSLQLQAEFSVSDGLFTKHPSVLTATSVNGGPPVECCCVAAFPVCCKAFILWYRSLFSTGHHQLSASVFTWDKGTLGCWIFCSLLQTAEGTEAGANCVWFLQMTEKLFMYYAKN